MATAEDKLSQYENWVHIFPLNDYGRKEVSCDLLFNKQNRSTDGVELYKKIETSTAKNMSVLKPI